ncbi:hypothetical protein [Staphylococcus simulans]
MLASSVFGAASVFVETSGAVVVSFAVDAVVSFLTVSVEACG